MPKRKTRASAAIDALLEDILEDAYGDDEQLWSLRERIAEAFAPPLDVHVVGEPLSLVTVDYDGNERRGLTALCRRDDGSEYRVSLADVQLAADAEAYPYLAAYCQWVGVEPVAGPRGSQAKTRKHKATDEQIDLTKPVELIVLAVKERAARCRLVGSDRVLTLRARSLAHDCSRPGRDHRAPQALAAWRPSVSVGHDRVGPDRHPGPGTLAALATRGRRMGSGRDGLGRAGRRR